MTRTRQVQLPRRVSAYTLLSVICDVITAEPRRYNQHTTLYHHTKIERDVSSYQFLLLTSFMVTVGYAAA